MDINRNPTPAGDAFFDNERGVWLQDYNIWDGTTTKVVRYMYNGTQWIEDFQSKNVQNTVNSQNYSSNQVISNSQNNNEKEIEIKLTKGIPNTTAGISLKKSVINLNKSIIDLSKKTGIDLGDHKARVAVVMDYSGSMRSLYSSGAVQRVLTRLMPLALRFDDNGELDIWLFNQSYKAIESMNLGNFENYVTEVANKSGFSFGATSYAPVLNDVLKTYFGKKSTLFGGLFNKKQEEPPVFVIFITDGSNSDRSATNEVIKESANKKIFIQFVGIGNETFDYLQKLDDLKDRTVDNTGFIRVEDFEKLQDEEVYQMLLSQYPEWLKSMGLK